VLKAGLATAVLLILAASLAKADVDWRSKGAVTGVANQGPICASWAFAVTGVVEGATAIQTGTLPNLSEQQLVDCASPTCGGGDICVCPQIGCFFTYVQTMGECSEADYPYTARQGTCKRTCVPVVASGFARNWIRITPGNEDSLTAALDKAPVLARLEVGDHGQSLQSFLDYGPSSGVFSPATYDGSVVQWVVLVG